MTRQTVRLCMALLLVLLTAAAAWLWTRDYDRHPDPAARFTIEAAKVREDYSRYWLDIHLLKNGEKEHDLEQPVRLLTADGKIHEPADTVFAGNPKDGFTEIWLKFWLEKSDMEKNIDLRINGATLRVKTRGKAPEPPEGGEVVFKSSDWGKSWLGF